MAKGNKIAMARKFANVMWESNFSDNIHIQKAFLKSAKWSSVKLTHENKAMFENVKRENIISIISTEYSHYLF